MSRAAEHFVNDVLPLGDKVQRAEDYVQQVSATTGLPHVLARKNMQKIRGMLAEMSNVLNGLTSNIDWEILDRGFGEVEGHALSFFPRTNLWAWSCQIIHPACIRSGFPLSR